jgi:hypothetical protein
MPNTPEQFVAWCLAHPTDNASPGASWDQKCGSLVFRAGGFSESKSSAYYAAVATEANGHKLDRTMPFDEIPFGWFVYFDKAGKNNGHIGMSMGDGTFLSANWRSIPMTPKHLGLGVMSTAYYASISDRYMGASPYFIDATLDGVSTLAGLNSTPLKDTQGLDDDMKVYANVDTNVWAVGGPGIWWAIPVGKGADYERDYGPRIALSSADFAERAAMYLSARATDIKVYANIDTNAWAVAGPGWWYPIPAGEGALWENQFGAHQAVDGATFSKLITGFVG